jgi:hypothetical protein
MYLKINKICNKKKKKTDTIIEYEYVSVDTENMRFSIEETLLESQTISVYARRVMGQHF